MLFIQHGCIGSRLNAQELISYSFQTHFAIGSTHLVGTVDAGGTTAVETGATLAATPAAAPLAGAARRALLAQLLATSGGTGAGARSVAGLGFVLATTPRSASTAAVSRLFAWREETTPGSHQRTGLVRGASGAAYSTEPLKPWLALGPAAGANALKSFPTLLVLCHSHVVRRSYLSFLMYVSTKKNWSESKNQEELKSHGAIQDPLHTKVGPAFITIELQQPSTIDNGIPIDDVVVCPRSSTLRFRKPSRCR